MQRQRQLNRQAAKNAKKCRDRGLASGKPLQSERADEGG
jgi:hypothetical protein